MKKIRLQVLLMVITILGVTGFQLFWLRQSFQQEEKTLSIKTDLALRDAIQNLQVSKLKLDSTQGDSAKITKLKMLAGDSLDESISVRVNNKKGIVSTINVITKKMGIQQLKDTHIPARIFVSKESLMLKHRPGLPDTEAQGPLPKRFYSLLYGVDSMQDSIRLPEIDSALTNILKQRNLVIPFHVSRLDSNYESKAPAINEVSIGFAHPVTYKLILGNTMPYLLKQLRLPMLFSILLLGIMILSFVLLYRNLLQQRRLTAIKNEFIGNITHELKTPIATVSVAIEAMKNFNALQSPERTQEYLDISSNELQRLSLLVDKVLSLSKFEKNEIEIKKERFDLVQLIREVIESMKLQFEKKNTLVNLQLTGTNFLIEADQRHISSVIYNLLDNALKYSKEGPRIDITVIDQSHYIETRVSDNGIGIAAEYKRKIFDQFFRVPDGDRHNIKGYGLGLSYVNYIVTSHRGLIEVESELGKGSAFIVKLPFTEADVVQYDKEHKIIKDNFKL